MSQGNVDLVRDQYARWNAREFDAWIEAFDPEVEYMSSVVASMDGGGVYRGHEGVRQFVREYFEGWEQFRLQPNEYIDAGPHVAVVLRATAQGRGSGIEIDREIAHVWTFRDGRAVRHQSFTSRAEALAALERS
jgi:hypothetical protein